jgi:hypothetical protein
MEARGCSRRMHRRLEERSAGVEAEGDGARRNLFMCGIDPAERETWRQAAASPRPGWGAASRGQGNWTMEEIRNRGWRPR